ncbi:hypothetical protein BDV96DRAFT_600853 [Lophiotrema nucula]|uniref:Uncharacterized protein n=1 Tax=Lophiotrema nucula TaxID=690887 RepID=A0A6A5Z519_9PLEO|nr:hypothetical protein BDV96DRAFT_600853 [Lophiotrema nucula]
MRDLRIKAEPNDQLTAPPRKTKVPSKSDELGTLDNPFCLDSDSEDEPKCMGFAPVKRSNPGATTPRKKPLAPDRVQDFPVSALLAQHHDRSAIVKTPPRLARDPKLLALQMHQKKGTSMNKGLNGNRTQGFAAGLFEALRPQVNSHGVARGGPSPRRIPVNDFASSAEELESRRQNRVLESVESLTTSPPDSPIRRRRSLMPTALNIPYATNIPIKVEDSTESVGPALVAPPFVKFASPQTRPAVPIAALSKTPLHDQQEERDPLTAEPDLKTPLPRHGGMRNSQLFARAIPVPHQRARTINGIHEHDSLTTMMPGLLTPPLASTAAVRDSLVNVRPFRLNSHQARVWRVKFEFPTRRAEFRDIVTAASASHGPSTPKTTGVPELSSRFRSVTLDRETPPLTPLLFSRGYEPPTPKTPGSFLDLTGSWVSQNKDIASTIIERSREHGSPVTPKRLTYPATPSQTPTPCPKRKRQDIDLSDSSDDDKPLLSTPRFQGRTARSNTTRPTKPSPKRRDDVNLSDSSDDEPLMPLPKVPSKSAASKLNNAALANRAFVPTGQPRPRTTVSGSVPPTLPPKTSDKPAVTSTATAKNAYGFKKPTKPASATRVAPAKPKASLPKVQAKRPKPSNDYTPPSMHRSRRAAKQKANRGLKEYAKETKKWERMTEVEQERYLGFDVDEEMDLDESRDGLEQWRKDRANGDRVSAKPFDGEDEDDEDDYFDDSQYEKVGETIRRKVALG